MSLQPHQQYPRQPGTYAVSFWIKNAGCDWTFSIGGVAPKIGEYDRLSSSELRADTWKLVRREYALDPKYDSLRLELSITSPGTLWIDGVTIEPAS